MKLNFFDLWNNLKQKVNNAQKTPYFRVGEIRWIWAIKKIRPSIEILGGATKGKL